MPDECLPRLAFFAHSANRMAIFVRAKCVIEMRLPSKAMEFAVLGTSHNLKVIGMIVAFVAILVMHNDIPISVLQSQDKPVFIDS